MLSCSHFLCLNKEHKIMVEIVEKSGAQVTLATKINIYIYIYMCVCVCVYVCLCVCVRVRVCIGIILFAIFKKGAQFWWWNKYRSKLKRCRHNVNGSWWLPVSHQCHHKTKSPWLHSFYPADIKIIWFDDHIGEKLTVTKCCWFCIIAISTHTHTHTYSERV